MGTKKIVGTLSSLVLLGALISLAISIYGWPLRVDTRAQQALGAGVAAEALKLGGGSGGRYILITRDTSLFKNPAFDAINSSCLATLSKAGVKVAITHRLKIDPLRVTAVPPGDFQLILKKTTENDVVISLLGPAVLTAEQVSAVGNKLPKTVAICSGAMPRQIALKRLFELGLLNTVVVSKPAVSPAPPTDAPAAWFDHLYLLVNASNLGDLPAPASPHP